MTAVEKYFFTPLYQPRGIWSVIRWWESRRLFYNLWVGGAGLLTLGVAAAISFLPPFPFWLRGVFVYGVMANLCYSLGAPVDLFLRRFMGRHAAVAGPVLFRYGFVFAMGLTLLPIPLTVIGWVLRHFFS